MRSDDPASPVQIWKFYRANRPAPVIGKKLGVYLLAKRVMEEKVLDTNWFVGNTEKYACPVCLGVLRDAVQAIVGSKCGHSFCEPCAETVFKGPSTPCPLCRETVTKQDLHASSARGG
eukprot:g20588.t1